MTVSETDGAESAPSSSHPGLMLHAAVNTKMLCYQLQRSVFFSVTRQAG